MVSLCDVLPPITRWRTGGHCRPADDRQLPGTHGRDGSSAVLVVNYAQSS